MKTVEAEGSSSKRRNCVLTVAAEDTGGNIVAAEGVLDASPGITQVFVTAFRVEHQVKAEQC